jgi:haloalkane dehalogenase
VITHLAHWTKGLKMQYLTTPAKYFEHLPNYPFSEKHVKIDAISGMRMHFVDEGERNSPIILMLHGEPSWSFLYREMITVAVEAGFRVIAPDLIGFGKSDKPTSQESYTYANHLIWLECFLEKLNLKNINLICQDWGGLLGLRLVAKYPDKFLTVVAANTFLPTGDEGASDAFKKWQSYSQTVTEFPVGSVIQNATCKALNEEIVNAYNAPFPTEEYKAGVRKFPLLVPTTPYNVESENNRQAWLCLNEFNKPFLTVFGDSDPITKGAEKALQHRIPGCIGQNHIILPKGGHFLQEDVGKALITASINFYKHNNKED